MATIGDASILEMTHLSECGKEKLKNWHVITAKAVIQMV